MFPWFLFWHESPADRDERLKREADENNRKFLLRVEREIPQLLRDFGFNTFTMKAHPYGLYCFISYKKYPNLWAHFTISKEKIDDMIRFQYYINDHHSNSFVISLTQLLQMIEFDGIKDFTKDMFDKMIDMMFKTSDFAAFPYTYHIEQDGLLEYFSKKDLDKLDSRFEDYLYFTQENGCIKMNRIDFNGMQHKLLSLFRYGEIDYNSGKEFIK